MSGGVEHASPAGVRLRAIVNVSSGAARSGSPNDYVDYAASKGAIDSFATGLAREVAAGNIRVNGVRSGFIPTGTRASGGEPDRVECPEGRIRTGRGGTAEKVARAIPWPLSVEASCASVTCIDVTGGVV